MVAADPSGRFLYTANTLASNLSAFAITPSTGALTPIGDFALTSTIGIAFEPSGRFAYAFNQGGGQIQPFAIDQTTGALTPGTLFDDSVSFAAVSAHPSGRFLYVSTTGGLMLLEIDPVTGDVSNPSTVGLGYGATSNIGQGMDPNGRYVYSASGGEVGGIGSFALDANGVQTQVNCGPVATPGCSDSNGSEPTAFTVASTPVASVAVHPSGKFVYVAPFVGGDITFFTVDQLTGTLTAGTPVSAGSSRSMTVEPNGRFAYVADSGDIVRFFSIDQITGVLTATTTVATGGNPFSIAIVESAQ
jgi:6-phosphogluconolactonase (cycloisomerase 2 family)